MYTEVDAIIQLIWPYSTEVDDLKLAIIRVRVRNLNYLNLELISVSRHRDIFLTKIGPSFSRKLVQSLSKKFYSNSFIPYLLFLPGGLKNRL